jgi:hypothetical protein
MPDSRRPWTEDDVAKLETMAGKVPAAQIVAALGQSLGATVVQASKLGISLRTQRRGVRAEANADESSLTSRA